MISDSPPKNQEPCIHDVTHYRKQGASMLITVPKSLRRLLNWKDGEVLVMSALDNTLVVLPVTDHMREQLAGYVEKAEPFH